MPRIIYSGAWDTSLYLKDNSSLRKASKKLSYVVAITYLEDMMRADMVLNCKHISGEAHHISDGFKATLTRDKRSGTLGECREIFRFKYKQVDDYKAKLATQ